MMWKLRRNTLEDFFSNKRHGMGALVTKGSFQTGEWVDDQKMGEVEEVNISGRKRARVTFDDGGKEAKRAKKIQ